LSQALKAKLSGLRCLTIIGAEGAVKIAINQPAKLQRFHEAFERGEKNFNSRAKTTPSRK